jgi:hypothetical protein
MPIQAVKNHDKSLVYTAQVNKSRQMDKYVETPKASSFFDSKKQSLWVQMCRHKEVLPKR